MYTFEYPSNLAKLALIYKSKAAPKLMKFNINLDISGSVYAPASQQRRKRVDKTHTPCYFQNIVLRIMMHDTAA